MGASKVVFGGRVVVDLTSDTVTAADLKAGVTAHGADGEQITGTFDGEIFLSGGIFACPDALCSISDGVLSVAVGHAEYVDGYMSIK